MPPKEEKPQPGGVVLFVRKFSNVVMTGGYCGEVKGPFTIRQCINLHKLLVLPIYLAFIKHFGGDFSLSQEWGPAASVLLMCHSLYGFFWVYKDIYFPDASWQNPMNCIGFLTVFIWPLGTYYLPMFCLVSRGSPYECPLGYFGTGKEPRLVALGLGIYIVGFFYHFCADLQKHTAMGLQRPRQLITGGLLAHCRNPNYFGEIMLYLAYCTLSMNWLCFVLFPIVWLMLFVPNMLAKEASMSRHKPWKAWKARTGLVVPWLPALLGEFFCNALSRLPNIEPVEKED